RGLSDAAPNSQRFGRILPRAHPVERSNPAVLIERAAASSICYLDSIEGLPMVGGGLSRRSGMNLSEYIASVTNAASTILEGMAVTFSHLFREPITIQYPDKTDRPVVDMLPPRYRGLLEVQMDICTGCKRCERACPIEVIAIDLTKDPTTKKQMMSRFD